ncbi:hypothetical protein TVAG_341370 [Trichomonas vaginalis G3]|uniref:Alpha/beta hydrolase fold-3 domain-containing protein n=1 Tax=Trichomonas vaginalis (strain ATCC PRA-98 / G3) TaxID=412133 RepID=A2DTU6_TRIV3|nr:carboxylic ester hydrolase protein [Trichomonas vaginalis G3]EAY16243.1 hypothetical protein TVAG_341370 [Trichomonas vaginalis G3]KAI5493252.1 carboxylic ester hydrolase protein [Trichomonas vaginalis G3]|eukprot:XP_001328466.1 hypothetical protein [Trichomonas vaginalis G3]
MSIGLKVINFHLKLFNFKKQLENECKSKKFWINPTPFPFFLKWKYDFSETKFQNRSYWTVKPKNAESNKVFLYFHGGAYIRNIIFWQWMMVADLISRTNATFIVPNYQIAPFWKYNDTYEFIKANYLEILEKYPGKEIEFIGDSAGGGFILSLSMSLRDSKIKQPKHLFLLSPWIDVTGKNPGYHGMESIDLLSDYEGGRLASDLYVGDLEKTDPRISPIFGEFHDLPRMTIFVGTHDCLVADCRILHKKLNDAKIEHEYHEFPNMFHVFMAITPLKEAQIANQRVADVVNKA